MFFVSRVDFRFFILEPQGPKLQVIYRSYNSHYYRKVITVNIRFKNNAIDFLDHFKP